MYDKGEIIFRVHKAHNLLNSSFMKCIQLMRGFQASKNKWHPLLYLCYFAFDEFSFMFISWPTIKLRNTIGIFPYRGNEIQVFPT